MNSRPRFFNKHLYPYNISPVSINDNQFHPSLGIITQPHLDIRDSIKLCGISGGKNNTATHMFLEEKTTRYHNNIGEWRDNKEQMRYQCSSSTCP